MRGARFRIEGGDPSELIIRDIGPWTRFPTITNDAAAVVSRLLGAGTLKPGQRLFYYDSEGRLDEILVKDGRFIGFKPGHP